MSFNAKVLVQGAANYVPHTDLAQLLVLFPSQLTEAAKAIRAKGSPEPICRHRLAVQFSAQLLDPQMPDTLLTLDASNCWLTIEATGARPLDLEEATIPGIFSGAEVLDAAGIEIEEEVNPAALPGGDSSFDSKLLAGGLYVDHGSISATGKHMGRHVLVDEKGKEGDPVNTSNTVEIDLGNKVTGFKLHFVPFDGTPSVVVLDTHEDADGGEVSVWVRHFCNLGQDPRVDLESPDLSDASEEERLRFRTDEDFVLNYLLMARYAELVKAAPRGLPAPRSSLNFGGGGSVSGWPHRCQPCTMAASDFDSI